RGRIGALVQAITDPLSGQPEAKATPASIAPLRVRHYGVLLSRTPLDVSGTAYWARWRTASGYATHLALSAAPSSWGAWASGLLPPGERLFYEDRHSRNYRVAVVRGQRLEAVLYMGKSPAPASLDWLAGAFAGPLTTAAERRALLAGRPLLGGAQGEILC